MNYTEYGYAYIQQAQLLYAKIDLRRAKRKVVSRETVNPGTCDTKMIKQEA
jgi:hypothetical protein